MVGAEWHGWELVLLAVVILAGLAVILRREKR